MKNSKKVIFSPVDGESSIRLDQYLAVSNPEHSRSYWQKLCGQEQIIVNGVACSSNKKLIAGDEIIIHLPVVAIKPIKIPTIYEDINVIVLDKPTGLLTHSKGSFNDEFTVAGYMKPLIDDDTNRAGIVHRLDRDTSGIIICAKNATTKKYLQKQFSSRKVIKEYIALTHGKLEHMAGNIIWPIERNPKKPQTFRVSANGKYAETKYEVIDSHEDISLVKLTPKTGRTHQLRVHMAHLGNPIVGDRFYTDVNNETRLFLHASKLQLNIPDLGTKTFESKLPQIFKKRLQNET